LQQIEHLKLVTEKYHRMIFGRKREKLTGQLEQLELNSNSKNWRLCKVRMKQHKPQRKPLLQVQLRQPGNVLHEGRCPSIFRVKS
jgi:hypothetical protein